MAADWLLNTIRSTYESFSIQQHNNDYNNTTTTTNPKTSNEYKSI